MKGVIHTFLGVLPVLQDIPGDGAAQCAVLPLGLGNGLLAAFPVQPQDFLVPHFPASFRLKYFTLIDRLFLSPAVFL